MGLETGFVDAQLVKIQASMSLAVYPPGDGE
jgi:hypothetical protein